MSTLSEGFRAPPPDLVRTWERRLARSPHLLDPDVLDRGIGYPHWVDEQAGAFYRQAPDLARRFARKHRLSRRDARIVRLYADGMPQLTIAAKVHRKHEIVRMLIDRFAVFCRSKGISSSLPYRRRSVACLIHPPSST